MFPMDLLPRYVLNSARTAALAALGRLDATARYPIDCCFIVTWRCNLRCRYCYESVGQRPPSRCQQELDTDGLRRALANLRQVVDVLVVSGGEPTCRADIVEILACAHELGFREIVLNTNLVRLPDLAFLDHVDQVMVGLDALTCDSFVALTRGTEAQFKQQMENLELLLRLRQERRFDLCLSSVIVADRLHEVERILDFCVRHQVLVAFSPHVADLKVDPALRRSRRYRELADNLYRARQAGLPLLGTPAYYRGIRDLAPFRCIPMANLTLEPDGRMRWPCGEADPAGPSFADGESWPQMIAAARAEKGEVPKDCQGRCHFGCRLALSSLVNRPWDLPSEALHLWRHKRYSR